MTAPPAQGARINWDEVPGRVRAAIEQVCGAPVLEARTQPCGFSPGVAARAVCANGTRCFIKAVHIEQLAALETTWAAHASGDTPLHTDVRPDNLLLTDCGVVLIDWPHACRGAAFVEPVIMAPSVAMQGGPAPAELLARSRAARTAPHEALTAVVCAIAGYFTERALRPPPPGLPTVRAFQAAQGEVARRWLAQLI